MIIESDEIRTSAVFLSVSIRKYFISIDIFDINGGLVTNLFNGYANSGKNQFTFNKSNLNNGSYFLNISSNSKILKNEKIIIVN